MEEGKSSQYKYSIITVTYNCVNSIEKTILSIIPLLSNEVEYIIIDGGSNDGTLSIIEQFSTVPHMRYISEPDTGIYNAMNKGVLLTRGKWFTFVNCGDLLYKIPKISDSTITRNIVAVAFAVESEHGIDFPLFNNKLRIFNTVPHQGLYYKKDTFLGFDERYKIFADYALNLDYLNSGYTIKTFNELVAYHSMEGLSNDVKYKSELEHILYNKNPLFYFIIAISYFKIKGIQKRFNKLLFKLGLQSYS